jgi:hypothetical protein
MKYYTVVKKEPSHSHQVPSLGDPVGPENSRPQILRTLVPKSLRCVGGEGPWPKPDTLGEDPS